MNQEINDFLRENLTEAHTTFKSIMAEMQEANIPFEYEFLKQSEEIDYNKINDLLLRMNNAVYEFNNLTDKSKELIGDKHDYYIKYISLYIIAILFFKLINTAFNSEEFSKMWNFVIGLSLGSVFIGLLNKDLNEYQSDTKEKRELINRLKTLKEEYKENHDLAVIMIDYIYALNERLWNELDDGKKLIKK